MIANARMYSVAPPATAAWRQLLLWVLDHAGLGPTWSVIDHAAPAPLPSLWDRPDIGCVFMCGLPFAQRRPQPIALAAPVPSPPRYAGQARYASDLIVRADAPFRRLQDTFGLRMAYTELHSQSGHQALVRYLNPWRTAERPRLYAEMVGPLTTPRRVLQAIVDGEADIGPLDSYAHDLLRLHEPQWTARVRTLASTEFTPNPLLVCAEGTSAATVAALREALLAVEGEPSLAGVRGDLLLQRFAVVPAASYAVLAERATDATAGL